MVLMVLCKWQADKFNGCHISSIVYCHQEPPSNEMIIKLFVFHLNILLILLQVIYSLTSLICHKEISLMWTTALVDKWKHTGSDVTTQFGFLPEVAPGEGVIYVSMVYKVNSGKVSIKMYNPSSGLKDPEEWCLLLKECKFVATINEPGFYVDKYECFCISQDCPLFVTVAGMNIDVKICEIMWLRNRSLTINTFNNIPPFLFFGLDTLSADLKKITKNLKKNLKNKLYLANLFNYLQI